VQHQTIGIIGGTGIGEHFAARHGTERIITDTPFGPPSGPLLRTEIDGMSCIFLSRHGDGHLLNPSAVPYRANVYALKKAGVTRIIATGATGSLREQIKPGELVICDQVVDKTFRREATFFDKGLVAHVELADPFCNALRTDLLAAAHAIKVNVHDGGMYVCMEGPQFSTRAESRLHQAWGGDLIGMTCMPEARLAREAEICYALIAMPTDYDSWRPHAADSGKQALLNEIMSNMKFAADAATALIDAAIKRLSQEPPRPCACQSALELAVWSDKNMVDSAVVERLRLLVGRYFQK